MKLNEYFKVATSGGKAAYLGSGDFATVYKGYPTFDTATSVAIKHEKPTGEPKELYDRIAYEVSILLHLRRNYLLSMFS